MKRRGYPTPPSSGKRRKGRSGWTVPRTPQPTRRSLTNALVNAAVGALPAQYRLPVRGAMWAGQKIAGAYKSYRTRKMIRRKTYSTKRIRKGMFGGMSTGFYVGKFKKPGSAKRGQGLEKQCQKKGHLINLEVHGDVADPDCVYITHSTYSVAQYAKVMAYALIRKLFVKGGFNPDSVDQEVPFADYNDGYGMKIQYILKNGSGATFPTSYTTVNDDTVSTILLPTRLPLIDSIAALLTNYTTGEYLERLQMYSRDGNEWRLKTELNLEREVITMYASSDLVIQNRTKGAATGAGAELERVDNQPLRGFTYICAGGVPKTQTMGVTPLDTVDVTGVQLVRAAELNSSLKEPPVPNYFINCYKRGAVQLEPGQMKSASIYKKFRGFFNDVIGRMRNSGVGSGISAKSQIVDGKCQIFALEERLNSGSLNNITVSYEVQKRYGCFFTTSKKSIMLASYDFNVQSNVP